MNIRNYIINIYINYGRIAINIKSTAAEKG
jgi:hypothetical protein